MTLVIFQCYARALLVLASVTRTISGQHLENILKFLLESRGKVGVACNPRLRPGDYHVLFLYMSIRVMLTLFTISADSILYVVGIEKKNN